MKARRKKNINLGFLPLGWKPTPRETKQQRAQRRKDWKTRIRTRVKSDDAEYTRLRKSARAARPGKKKLETLFHEVYGREPNPRELPETTRERAALYQKLIGGKAMATKKRNSKKKNSRKGKMPAGLKAYWAKKRAKSNPRKRKARKNPKARVKTRTVIKYRTRTIVKRARRRNPPKPKTIKVRAPFPMTASQLKKYARAVGRAMGRRARVVKP